MRPALVFALAMMGAFASFGVGAFTAVFTDNRLAQFLAGAAAFIVCTFTTLWVLTKVGI